MQQHLPKFVLEASSLLFLVLKQSTKTNSVSPCSQLQLKANATYASCISFTNQLTIPSTSTTPKENISKVWCYM